MDQTSTSIRGFRQSLADLSASQKSGAGEPAYLRWVNRPLGRVAAAAAHQTRLTPNAVSVISALFSLLGVALLVMAQPSWAVAFGATLLFAIGYVLDSADGQLARLTKSGSPAGEWLDHVLDAARAPMFHLAVAASFYFREDSEALWQVGVALAFSVLVSVRFFALTLAEKLQPGRWTDLKGVPLWHSFAKQPLDVATSYLLLLTLPMLVVFTWGYTLLFAFMVLSTAGSLARKYRSLAA